MLILSCDTSSIASGALLRVPDDAGAPEAAGPDLVGRAVVLGSFATEDTRSHAEATAPGLRRLLEQAGVPGTALGLILVGIGPGPFTGLRAGIMTARALGWAWGVPVRGVMSLDALAEAAHRDLPVHGAPFLAAADARRREVYAAAYRTDPARGWAREAGPAVGKAEGIRDLLGPALTGQDRLPPVVGRGAGLYPEQLPALPGWEQAHPQAADLARAGVRRGLNSLDAGTSPLYLRESDAVVPAARKKATR